MNPTTVSRVAALGSRLRRLLERLDREVLGIYQEAGERFEPSWFAVFTAVRDHGPLTVGELARRLGVSHAAVSQVRTALERERLVHGAPDPRDGRRQFLSLTPKGHETARRLAPLWTAILDATSRMLTEHAPTLLADLDALETALDQLGLRARINASFSLETPNDQMERADDPPH
jgi:MarR family transcriptional regulator, organic hydroperoxide resistance regulator